MGSIRFIDLRCVGLADADTFGGKSDGFCKVKIGGLEQKTETVDDKRDPVWKHPATKWKTFPLTADPWSTDINIEFAVWDEDITSNDFLGKAIVPLKSILPKKPSGKGPHKVQSTAASRDTGFELRPREGNSDDAKFFKKKGGFGSVQFTLSYEEDVKVGNTAVSAPKPDVKLPSAKDVTPTLKFVHLSAEHLIPEDGSSSDPYLIMKLPGFSTTDYKTETLQKTLCPTWKKSAEWSLDLTKGVLPMMEFFVYDADTISADDFIGYASKQLAPADLKHGCESSFQLSLTVRPGRQTDDGGLFKMQKDEARRTLRSLGSLKVVVSFLGEPGKLRVPAGNEGLTLKPLYDNFMASLRVRLLRGVDLAAVGGGGDLTPYVEIACEDASGLQVGAKITTQKVEDSTDNQLDPVWEHEYLRIEDARKIAQVRIYLKHSRLLGDIHCGYATIPLAFGRPSKDAKCVLALNPRLGNDGDTDRDLLKKLRRNHFGELLIDYDYQVVKPTELTQIMKCGAGAKILPKRCRLTIYIDKIEGLLWDDEDVLLKLQLGNRVMEMSKSVKATGSAANVRYSFEADVDRERMLAILTVSASNLLSKDCMGVAQVDIDLRKNATQPTAVNASLYPGNVADCLQKLNKHIAAHGSPTMGTMSLSYKIADVDAKANDAAMAAAAKAGPKQKTKETKQADTDTDTDTDEDHSTYDTSQQPAYNKNKHNKNAWLLNLQVCHAEGLPSRSYDEACNPYVVIRRRGLADEEFKTCVVSNTTDPKWQYMCTMENMLPQEELLLSVFDQDMGGYDSFLGEATLRTAELLKGDRKSLRDGAAELLPRKNADGTISDTLTTMQSNMNSAPHKRSARLFFKWKLVEEKERTKQLKRQIKPAVLDVFMHSAANLAAREGSMKYASVTLNGKDERQTQSDHEPSWGQEFQFGVMKEINVLKVSLWEEGQFARYLGEAIIEVDTTAQQQGNQVVQLQPRQDPHYNKEDVRLLNASAAGLGVVTLSWCLRSGDTRRQFPMDPYTVVLHVIEAVDVPHSTPTSQYFITAQIKGGDNVKYSQVEQGVAPKFRTQFDFLLRHDVEEMVVQLHRRSTEGKAKDVLVSHVMFPVGPVQSEASTSERTWCTMTSAKKDTKVAPRLLCMWKAITNPQARSPHPQDTRMHRGQAPKSPASFPLPSPDEASRPCMYEATTHSRHEECPYPLDNPYTHPRQHQHQHPDRPMSPYSMSQQAYPPRDAYTSNVHGTHGMSTSYSEDAEKDIMRQQLSSLTAENEQLQEQLRKLQRMLSGSRGSVVEPPRRTVTISVEQMETKRKAVLRVALPTDAYTVMELARRELDLSASTEYVLRWMGSELTPDDPLEGLTDGDTVMLNRSETFLTRRSPRFGRARGDVPQREAFNPMSTLSSRVGTPPSPQHVSRRRDMGPSLLAQNEAVLSRLHSAASSRQEHLTVAFWTPRVDDAVIVTAVSRSGFSGFARPHPAKANYSEVVLQGSAVELVPTIMRVFDQAEQLGVKVELVEVKGYIPLLTTSFLVTSDLDEGARMWEKSCRPANIPGGGKKAWFYRSTEGINEDVPGIVVIDERA